MYLNACKQIIESQMLQLFLIPYIPVRNSKKSFALTFKHLFSAINIILKQLLYIWSIFNHLPATTKMT